MPEEVAAEPERYAGYLQGLVEQQEWERFSLALLDARYAPDDAQYTVADGRSRPDQE